MENKDLNCIVITVVPSYSSAPTLRLSYKYRERRLYWPNIRTHTYTDTPALTVHFGSPSSNRELQVRRVSANRKARKEWKESTINAKAVMVQQRFRGRTNRYAGTQKHSHAAAKLAATLSCLLHPWPLSSSQAVWKSLFLFCKFTLLVLNNSFFKFVY